MLLFGTLIRMVGAFVFVLFAASKLGLDGFGAYSVATFYYELMVSLAATAVGILLTRDVARWRRHCNQLTTSALAATGALSCVAALVLVLGCYFSNFSLATKTALTLSAVAILPGALGMVLEALLVGLERAEFVTMGVTIESVVRLGGSFVALMMGCELWVLFVILVISRSLQLVFYLACSWRVAGLRLSLSPHRTRRFARRWLVFAGENWLATIYTSLDVLVLSIMVGEAAVGIYSAAWKVIRLGSVVAKTYTTAVFPVMSQLHHSGSANFKRVNEDTVRLMLAISLPLICALTLVSDRVIALLYDLPEFAASIPVLQVLIWVLLTNVLNPFLSHRLFAEEKQHKSLYVASIGFGVNFVATIVLTYFYQELGAAIGTLISGLVAMVMYMYFAMSREELNNAISICLRSLVIGAAIACVVMFNREASLPWLVVMCIPVYAALTWALQVIQSSDMRIIK